MGDEVVWTKLVGIMRETFDRHDLIVSRETSARDVAEWDSLAHIELIVSIESTFSIKLRTGEIAGLKNAGELHDVIANKVRQAAVGM